MHTIRWTSLLLPVAFFMATLFASGQTRLAVPSYQNPGTTTWSSWAAQGPAALGIMIVDIDNGDDPTYYPAVDAA
ncbi:MAG: hypothetical protein WAN41_19725, partial [Candidatus Sulfotelmatobacter sp.]